MRLFRITVCMLAIAATSTATAFAQSAYNYTLNVPLSITNAPAGSWAPVSCFLQSGANGGGSELADGNSPREVLANGLFSGTVAVKLSSPTKPRSYGCAVVVVNNSQMLNISSINYTSSLLPGWTGTPTNVVNLP